MRRFRIALVRPYVSACIPIFRCLRQRSMRTTNKRDTVWRHISLGKDWLRYRCVDVFENIWIRPPTRRRIRNVFKTIHFGERSLKIANSSSDSSDTCKRGLVSTLLTIVEKCNGGKKRQTNKERVIMFLILITSLVIN